jgi:DNA polymerase I-like protein with 3'-5' exonuclease and polymerase domains
MPDDEQLDIDELLEGVPTAAIEPEQPTEAAPDPGAADDQAEFTFMEDMGLQQESRDGLPDLIKPWMKFHRFHLVKTIDEVRELVDHCIEHGRCALDLETEGFDNRIDYNDANRPYTRHKIVGYCISVRAEGYYLPLRHHFDQFEKDPNLPIDATNAEIKRLCEAAQPVLTEDGYAKDPYASSSIEKPSRCVIYFWHSKFDQEFLYPISDIDFWHPESFEDGLLAAYVFYTDDKNLGLKNKALENLRVTDPVTGNEYPYEMIKFNDLFQRAVPKHERRFAMLYPEDDSNCVRYGCSDAICTELLCEAKRDTKWAHTVKGLKYRYNEVLTEAQKQKFRSMYRLEKQTVQAVRVMERSRTLIDKKAVEALLKEAYLERTRYEDRVVQLAKGFEGFKVFNVGSSAQLSEFLFSERGLDIKPKPEKNEKSGQYKTDAATLESFVESDPDAPEVLKDIVKYRQVDKVIGTYLKSLAANTDEHDQLRFNFRQTGAATGRFTAPKGDPEHGFAGVPIHGIPARDDPNKPKVAHSLRGLFVAHLGYAMVKIDYAGQELRVVTCISGEPLWKKEFMEGSGDLHTLTAQAFFGSHITKANKIERTMGKIANFSLIYGGGTQAIMRATKCDRVEAARKKAAFDKSVPTFAQWVKKQHAFVKKHKGVYTGFRRFIAIPDANVKEGDRDERGNIYDTMRVRKVRAACERKSTNYPIQGCLQYGSLVNTNEGWKPIGELTKAEQVVTVWTGTRWARAWAHDMGECELADIALSDGTVILADIRHKLLVVSQQGYDWVEYPDLEPGMAVATSLCEPLEMEPPPLPSMEQRERSRARPEIAPSKIPELWYWLGRYIGDGWIDLRGAIIFCFGAHEREAIERCKAFWCEAGLNPSEAEGTSTRYRVEVWSVDLMDWLQKLGVEPATAHTKRVPHRVYCETLEHRRAFLQGVMDSDGHKPRLPRKINGVHLCQRPLLEDLKRVFRTVGVESVIRGPYQEELSYRLDLNRRMYERNVVEREGVRHPKFHDMFAPQFLVDEFLAHGPFARAAFEGDESAYTLYLRLIKNGRVTVYTLKRLCGLLGVELSFPIYGFKRIVAKERLGVSEHTYTLTVQDPLHRFEADGVITKNSGADILKISLVRLVKELHLRGWLKRDGDDSVRMLMTVHDEIVFEVKLERLMEVVPEIVRIMESPAKLVRWPIPLIVEPLVDRSWGAKNDWLEIMEGKAEIPEWLQPYMYVKPDWKLDEEDAPPPAKKAAAPKLAPSGESSEGESSEEESDEEDVSPDDTPAPPAEPEVAAVIDLAEVRTARQVVVFAIPQTYLTDQSIRLVAQAADEAIPIGTETDPTRFKRLRVVDAQGHTLIDPKLGIRVDPEEFGRGLQRRNLGPGTFDLVEDYS